MSKLLNRFFNEEDKTKPAVEQEPIQENKHTHSHTRKKVEYEHIKTDEEAVAHPLYNKAYAVSTYTLGKKAGHQAIHSLAVDILNLPEESRAKALNYD